ncbi:MAG: zinc ribbon domain-containing protein, partial [Pseudomonadota bacterium]
EYYCKACDKHMEILQKISDAALLKCPECDADNLKKLVSAASFQLKGDGWYVTDFRNKGKEKPKSNDSKGQKTTDNASEAATTTAASTETKTKDTKQTQKVETGSNKSTANE